MTATASPASLGGNFIRVGLLAIIAVMPFHAFIVIGLGHFLGRQALWQAWKEALIVAMLLAAALLAWRQRQGLLQLKQGYNYWALAFVAIGLLTSLGSGAFATTSFWYGLKTDVAMLLIFGLAQLVASRSFKRQLTKVHLVTAAMVSGIAVMLALIIAPTILTWFGYGPNTIMPAQGIAGSNLNRVFSTLGGPNQLGAFLILPICITTALLLRHWRWHYAITLALAMVSLFFTYSRSAWLGAFAGVATIVVMSSKSRRHQAIAGAILGLTIITGLFSKQLISIIPQLDAYLYHEDSVSAADLGSDDKRLAEWHRSATAFLDQPFGRGFGSAGPASFHSHQPLISENYFLQIGIETGIAGLIAFSAFQLLVGRALWQQQREHGLAVPLLAALVGINLVNLFLHGWADSTLALVYWTLAGVTLGSRT